VIAITLTAARPCQISRRWADSSLTRAALQAPGRDRAPNMRSGAFNLPMGFPICPRGRSLALGNQARPHPPRDQ
jgi:hypothetical protein